MKKAIKITILIAVGLVVLGLGMVFVSVAAGGFDIRNVVKTRTYVEKTYEVTEDFENLQLDFSSNDLQVLPSENGKMKLVCYESDNITYDVKVENKTLVIEEKIDTTIGSIFNFEFNFEDQTNKLYLPKDQYKDFELNLNSGDFTSNESFTFRDVNLDVSSGDVYLSDLIARDLFVDCSSGDVGLSGVSVENLTANVSSGRIDIENTYVNKILKMKSSSGSASLIKTQCTEADIRVGSGSIEVADFTAADGFDIHVSSGSANLNNVVTDGFFRVKTGSGSIRLESCDGKEMNLETSSGSIEGSLKSGKIFTAKASAGDIVIPEDDPNGGKCNLKTDSGDIEITVEP